MAKVKYIPCDIYKRGITVFIGSVQELKRWVQHEYKDESEKCFVNMIEHLPETSSSAASFNYNNMDGQGIVHIYKFPRTPKEIATLEHELLHATFHVLNFCNVLYDSESNNESFTYLLEHLTRCALEKEGYKNV